MITEKICEKLHAFFSLLKPKVVFAVALSAGAGYVSGCASLRLIDPARLSFFMSGLVLIASASAAFNQCQEHHIDKLMLRTRNRPLASGRLSKTSALVCAIALCVTGLIILYGLDPRLCAAGLFCLIWYNGLYTRYWKPRSALSVLPGALPGALPVLMGHCAATGRFLAPTAIYLTILLAAWQLPHTWCLAFIWRNDYARAKMPTPCSAYGRKTATTLIVISTLIYACLLFAAPYFTKVGLEKLSILPVIGFLMVSVMMVPVMMHKMFLLIKDDSEATCARLLFFINASLAALLLAVYCKYLKP